MLLSLKCIKPQNFVRKYYLLKENMEQLKYTHLIFDFHGTITDHQLRLIRAYHQAGHEAFDEHLSKNFYQEALTRPSHASGNGQTNREFISTKFYIKERGEIDNFLSVFDHVMNVTFAPIPSLRATIRTLTSMGVYVVLLTNGTNRNLITNTLCLWDQNDKFGIKTLSERLYSSHISGVKKPDEEAINFILRDLRKSRLSISQRTVLHIGDYIDDIQVAHNTNIDSVLFVRGNGQETFRIREPRPTYLITDPKELIEIVQGQRSPESREWVTINPVLWTNDNWYNPS